MKKKQEKLTSRERVIRAINFKPVDRMPIDLGVHFSTGISAFAYWNLRKHLGLATDNISVADFWQFLARVDDDILKRFHCDCKLLWPKWPTTQRWNPRSDYNFIVPGKPQLRPDGDGGWFMEGEGWQLRMPGAGFFFDPTKPASAEHPIAFDDRKDDEFLNETAQEAERIFKESDYATFFMAFGGYFRESDADWLCKMLLEPEEVIKANEIQCEEDIKRAGKVIDLMGKHIQGICLGGDLGTQTGPFCRPSDYERVSAPFLKKICSFIHKNSDLKTFYHCCGSIKPLIPILIDCGVDILNPIQISANNMDPVDLKKEFGGKIVFWGGGCDTQRVLGTGRPQTVSANVRKLTSIFKPNSGYVFNQVHNIMGNVPPENIVAMLDTAYECSFN